MQRDSLQPSAKRGGSGSGDTLGSSTPSWMKAPMMPGQFAASLGYQPVKIQAHHGPVAASSQRPVSPRGFGVRAGVMPEKSGLLSSMASVPKDGLLGARDAVRGAASGSSVAHERIRLSLASSDSDSESNPRATLVRKHEDKPVHPATVPAAAVQRDSPIEEEVGDYEEDWDEDSEPEPSPKPVEPRNTKPQIAAAATMATAPIKFTAPIQATGPPAHVQSDVQKPLMGGAAIADLLAAAEENERAILQATSGTPETTWQKSPVPAARGLSFASSMGIGTTATSDGAKVAAAAAAEGGVAVLPVGIDLSEALQDQSYATDSETEELEKQRFFQKVEQFGKLDYAALSARSATRAQEPQAIALAPPASSGSPPKVPARNVGGEGNAGGDALGAVTASVGSAIAGMGAEDSSVIKGSGAWSESVTDSPEKQAVSDNTMASTDVATILAGAEQRGRGLMSSQARPAAAASVGGGGGAADEAGSCPLTPNVSVSVTSTAQSGGAAMVDGWGGGGLVVREGISELIEEANERVLPSKTFLGDSKGGGGNRQSGICGSASSATGARATSPVEVEEELHKGIAGGASMGNQGVSSSIAELMAAAESNASKVLAAKKPPLSGSIGSAKHTGARGGDAHQRPSTAPGSVGGGGRRQSTVTSGAASSLRAVPAPTLTSSPGKVPVRTRCFEKERARVWCTCALRCRECVLYIAAIAFGTCLTSVSSRVNVLRVFVPVLRTVENVFSI